nr:uncharacterized protein LOC105862592 [Microcebus murinus]XP_012604445.1 uncharacterized protein LOC105862592 [Microcebus murinus]
MGFPGRDVRGKQATVLPACAGPPLMGRAQPSFAQPGRRQGGRRREGPWGLPGAMVPRSVASRMIGRGCFQTKSPCWLPHYLKFHPVRDHLPPKWPSSSLSELHQVCLEEEGAPSPSSQAAASVRSAGARVPQRGGGGRAGASLQPGQGPRGGAAASQCALPARRTASRGPSAPGAASRAPYARLPELRFTKKAPSRVDRTARTLQQSRPKPGSCARPAPPTAGGQTQKAPPWVRIGHPAEQGGCQAGPRRALPLPPPKGTRPGRQAAGADFRVRRGAWGRELGRRRLRLGREAPTATVLRGHGLPDGLSGSPRPAPVSLPPAPSLIFI